MRLLTQKGIHMKQALAVLVVSSALAGCASLSNLFSPTNDAQLTNLLIAAGPALSDYATYGCIQVTSLPSVGSVCAPTTSTNVTQQQAQLAQCYSALLVSIITKNKTCPVTAPAPAPAPPPAQKTGKITPTPTRWDQIHQSA
jgi:hypothetical protein